MGFVAVSNTITRFNYFQSFAFYDINSAQFILGTTPERHTLALTKWPEMMENRLGSKKGSLGWLQITRSVYPRIFEFQSSSTVDPKSSRPQSHFLLYNTLATSIIFWSKIPTFLNLHFKWSALFLRSFSCQNYGRWLRRRKRWKTHQKL